MPLYLSPEAVSFTPALLLLLLLLGLHPWRDGRTDTRLFGGFLVLGGGFIVALMLEFMTDRPFELYAICAQYGLLFGALSALTHFAHQLVDPNPRKAHIQALIAQLCGLVAIGVCSFEYVRRSTGSNQPGLLLQLMNSVVLIAFVSTIAALLRQQWFLGKLAPAENVSTKVDAARTARRMAMALLAPCGLCILLLLYEIGVVPREIFLVIQSVVIILFVALLVDVFVAWLQTHDLRPVVGRSELRVLAALLTICSIATAVTIPSYRIQYAEERENDVINVQNLINSGQLTTMEALPAPIVAVVEISPRIRTLVSREGTMPVRRLFRMIQAEDRKSTQEVTIGVQTANTMIGNDEARWITHYRFEGWYAPYAMPGISYDSESRPHYHYITFWMQSHVYLALFKYQDYLDYQHNRLARSTMLMGLISIIATIGVVGRSSWKRRYI